MHNVLLLLPAVRVLCSRMFSPGCQLSAEPGGRTWWDMGQRNSPYGSYSAWWPQRMGGQTEEKRTDSQYVLGYLYFALIARDRLL